MANTPSVLVRSVLALISSCPLYFFTDASRSWGCTYVVHSLHAQSWLQVAWPSEGLHPVSIALKELVPVTLALAVWGHFWTGPCRQLVLCHSNNMVVVGQLNSLHAQDPLASNILCCIALHAPCRHTLISASRQPPIYSWVP